MRNHNNIYLLYPSKKQENILLKEILIINTLINYYFEIFLKDKNRNIPMNYYEYINYLKNNSNKKIRTNNSDIKSFITYNELNYTSAFDFIIKKMIGKLFLYYKSLSKNNSDIENYKNYTKAFYNNYIKNISMTHIYIKPNNIYTHKICNNNILINIPLLGMVSCKNSNKEKEAFKIDETNISLYRGAIIHITKNLNATISYSLEMLPDYNNKNYIKSKEIKYLMSFGIGENLIAYASYGNKYNTTIIKNPLYQFLSSSIYNLDMMDSVLALKILLSVKKIESVFEHKDNEGYLQRYIMGITLHEAKYFRQIFLQKYDDVKKIEKIANKSLEFIKNLFAESIKEIKCVGEVYHIDYDYKSLFLLNKKNSMIFYRIKYIIIPLLEVLYKENSVYPYELYKLPRMKTSVLINPYNPDDKKKIDNILKTGDLYNQLLLNNDNTSPAKVKKIYDSSYSINHKHRKNNSDDYDFYSF